VIPRSSETPADWDPETGQTWDVGNVVHLREMHSGQLRVAERFVAAYAHRVLHVHGIGWHHWADTHWVEDLDGEVRRRVVQLLKDLRHESVEMSKEDRERLLSDVRKCESSGGVTGVLDLAKFMRPMTISAEGTNARPELFNARNGTLNLETGRLQPHDPRDLITKCAGTNVEPDAQSDLFDRFLTTVLPDADVRAYLARVFGVAMLGRVQEHILPILTGTGGNGKTVCLDAVLGAFGDYGITVDPKLIMRSKQERHATFLADLHGARLVVTSETNEGEVLAAATVKRLTGGDKIRANRMRENTFEFTPSHTLIYCTNHTPQVSAEDKAMWRRLSVIPFDVVVQDPDVSLPEKLKAHLPAVLAWVHCGWLDYQGQGLNPPATVLERTEAYRSDSDPIGQFISEECVTGPYVKVRAKALHEAWAMWSMRQGLPPMTATEFGKRMGERFEKAKSAGVNQYAGIGLAADENAEGGLM
jgi:putative DNA primase/helicase